MPKLKMKINWYVLFALVLLGLPAAVKAQSSTVTPDCVFFFTFTANGNIPASGYPNYPAQGVNGGGVCTNWVVSYTAFNIVGSISLNFQSAPSATAKTPGTWGTYGGTVVSGINPNTSSTGAQSSFANEATVSPFVRMHLAGLTSGTVTGVVYGYKTGFPGGTTPSGGSGCPGTVGTPCVVEGLAADGAAAAGNPVQNGVSDGTNIHFQRSDTTGRAIAVGASADNTATAGNPLLEGQSDGTNTHNVITCLTPLVISDSSSGTTQIIALSGTTRITICKLTLTTASPVTIQFTQGTGSNCGSGTTNLTGSYQSASTVAEDYAADNTYLVAVAGNAVCLNLGSGVATTGTLFYTRLP